MTLRYNDISITLRASRVRDGFFRLALDRVLAGEHPDASELFTRFVSRTVKAEGLPFELPTESSTPEQVKASYQSWLDMDETFAAEVQRVLSGSIMTDEATSPTPPPEGDSPNS